MANRPRVALVVTDVAASLAFYTDLIGFTIADSEPEADMATIIDSDGDPILLAGRRTKDIRSFLDEPRIIFKPGDTLDFIDNDLEARRAKLAKHGLQDVTLVENAWGDRKLTVKDPDGYIVSFITAARRSPEEILKLYEQGPADLENVLSSLSESDLDMRRAPGEWTIRQIVHHLAESASLFLMMIKTALAQSGATYVRNPYDQDEWVKALDYAHRPIEPSVALVKAIHAHISQLLHHFPDALDRYVLMKFSDEDPSSEGRKMTVGRWIEILARHLQEHCEEIRETRRVHSH